MSPVEIALDNLNRELLLADSIARSLDAAGGEEPPAWVHLFRERIDTITKAADAFETLMRKGGAL